VSSTTCRCPRPDPDTPAPVRFLYDFDNLLLSHADRTRVSSDEFRRAFVPRSGPVPGAVLVDGFTAGHWTLTQDRDSATLSVYPHRRLSEAEAEAVSTEATQVLEFLAPGQAANAVPGHLRIAIEAT
jgi:hypothetical protein